MASAAAGGFQIKSRQTDGQLINSADSPNNCKIFVGGISKNTNTGMFNIIRMELSVITQCDSLLKDSPCLMTTSNCLLLAIVIDKIKGQGFVNVGNYPNDSITLTSDHKYSH